MIMPEPPPIIDRPTKRLIAQIVWELWNSVLVGSPAPKIQERYERMHNPQWGDLVVEMSTLLRLVRLDPCFEDNRWDGQFVRFCYSAGDTHVCLNPDGTTFNWTNATLIAVPPFITKE